MSAVEHAVARLLGVRVTSTAPLTGGLHTAELADGRRVVAKRAAGAGANAAEAAGLRWLADTGDVPLPGVYAQDDDWLLLEHIAPGAPTAESARAFGRGLAALHLRGAAGFGAPPSGGPEHAWIGLASMRNARERDWATFYVVHRVEPYLRQARDRGALDAAQAAVIERACEHIGSIGGPEEPPARLHGDAWSGNLHWGDDGAVWLLDPAAHGGHRETDLAMMRLFGAPLLEVILDAYVHAADDAGAPLAPGVTERVGLHQLFPLLVHAVLFGGGYGAQAVGAARNALALR